MLIKDPYLGSQIKNRSFSTVQPKNLTQFNQKDIKPKQQYLSQPYKRPQQKQLINQTYQRQMRSMSQAYRNQQQAFRKMANLQHVNKQYNEAIKQRNYQLNAKLNDLAYEKSLLAQKHQSQLLKNTYDKDVILKKYEDQNEQILRLKRSNSQLMQQKSRLQSEIDHLMFLMQKDNHQGSLQIKSQLIRMQNMQRTLRGIIDTKDAQIIQLRHRLKIYQDENRRLCDLNKTLTITRQQKIDNISNISQIDSNIKQTNKQNIDINIRRDDYLISQLNQQKQLNKQLLSQITLMKKKLFEQPDDKGFKKNYNTKNQNKHQNKHKNKQQCDIILQQLNNLNSIRNNINNQVYQTYCKSIKQGQKQKKNSLLIFISNYKQSNIKQQLSSLQQYIRLRQQLKSSYKSTSNIQIKTQIQHQLPMKINSRQHNKDNQWVLSTMQLTKNQRNQSQLTKNQRNKSQLNKDSSGQSHNAILFLFRLLTIEYRTKNSLQGKPIKLQTDVQNQLLHSIVKATHSLIQLS